MCSAFSCGRTCKKGWALTAADDFTTLPRRRLVERLTDFMCLFGYQPVETPVIETAELFLTKAGYQIIDRLFTFDRLGQQLTLRPEFTAAALYRYISRFAATQPIVRWQFSGAVFEDAPARNSREYQHFSIGAELIGMDGPSTEAEIISMAAQGLDQSGVPDWRIVVGHVGLMRHLLQRFGLDAGSQRFLLAHLPDLKDTARGKAYVLQKLDLYLFGRGHTAAGDIPRSTDNHAEVGAEQLLDVLLRSTQRAVTMGGRTPEDIARRLLQKRQRAAERPQMIKALEFLERWSAILAMPDTAFAEIQGLLGSDDATAQRHLAHWREVLDLVHHYGIAADRIMIQPDLARSWDYYTGIVFELRTLQGRHVGGGGRYDELARLIGGDRDIPAVGFAYYVENLLSERELFEALPEARCVLVGISPATRAAGIRWVSELRVRQIAAQLLPTELTLAHPAGLVIQSDGSAIWNAQVVTLDQLDELAAKVQAAWNTP